MTQAELIRELVEKLLAERDKNNELQSKLFFEDGARIEDKLNTLMQSIMVDHIQWRWERNGK